MERRREERYGEDALCPEQRYREGMESTGYPCTAPHPYVSSYLFLLPVSDAPSSTERREKEGEGEREKIGEEEEQEEKAEEEQEREREGRRRRRRRRRDGLSIFIMFAPKKERQGEKGEKWRAERDSGNTRVEKRARATLARGTQEFTATGARVCKRPAKKKRERGTSGEKCAAEPM